jgi:hypothetical protein
MEGHRMTKREKERAKEIEPVIRMDRLEGGE